MTIRFRVADTREAVPANAHEKIRAHLESKGHRTTTGYLSYGGHVDVSLADSHSVDTILSSRYYLIPPLSKEPLHVSQPRHICIDNAFELCITGLNDYDGLHEIIAKWYDHTYVRDDAAKSSCIYDTRMTSDRENFLLTMDSCSTLHCPTYSGGVRRTPLTAKGLRRTPSDSSLSQECHILDSAGLCWSCWSPVESGGVQWSLPESGGVHFILHLELEAFSLYTSNIYKINSVLHITMYIE